MAVQPKIPRILHNLFKRSAQICPNIWDIIIQSPCWVSVIRDQGGGSSKDAHTFFCRTYMHTCVQCYSKLTCHTTTKYTHSHLLGNGPLFSAGYCTRWKETCLLPIHYMSTRKNLLKGQLNSEWIYEVIVSPKITTKFFPDLCPGSLLKPKV